MCLSITGIIEYVMNHFKDGTGLHSLETADKQVRLGKEKTKLALLDGMKYGMLFIYSLATLILTTCP